MRILNVTFFDENNTEKVLNMESSYRLQSKYFNLLLRVKRNESFK